MHKTNSQATSPEETQEAKPAMPLCFNQLNNDLRSSKRVPFPSKTKIGNNQTPTHRNPKKIQTGFYFIHQNIFLSTKQINTAKTRIKGTKV